MNAPSKLSRTLGLRYVIVVVIANILGSGVYKKVAPMAAELHSSGWVLIAWLLGGIITLFGALSNAEVAGLLADTGGEYAYFKKIYNRFFAFIFGWSLFTVIQTAAISSLAYVFAQSLNGLFRLPTLLPGWNTLTIGGIFFPFADFSVKLTAILLIILLTWINTRGVKTGAGLSNVILVLVFTGIFVIVFFGLGSPHAAVAQSISLHTTNKMPVTISAVFTAMLSAFWGYQGWGGNWLSRRRNKGCQKKYPQRHCCGGADRDRFIPAGQRYLSVAFAGCRTGKNPSGRKPDCRHRSRKKFLGEQRRYFYFCFGADHNAGLHACHHFGQRAAVLCHGAGRFVFSESGQTQCSACSG